jgi:predicted RNA-binding protein with PUA-like domain
MKHWLIKTEPGTYAWRDMCHDGKTFWDGVRNFQARNNIRAMRRGDRALFYHSVSEKRILGVVRIVSEPYPDPTARDGDWSAVDVEPEFAFQRPVTLAEIKSERTLRSMALLKQSRLSVQPVKKSEFDRVVALGGKAPLG